MTYSDDGQICSARSATFARLPRDATTRPAEARSATARCAVLGATSYRVDRSATVGSASPVFNAPQAIAARRSAAIRRYGAESGDRWAGISAPSRSMPAGTSGIRPASAPAARWSALGVLLPRVGAGLGDARPDSQDPGGKVEPVPAERAQLAAPGAGHHGEPHEHAPVEVAPRLGGDARGLVGRGRLRIGPDGRGRLGLLDRVGADPAPADGPLAGATEDAVDLPDGRIGERLARVRAAPVGPAGMVSTR